MCLGCLAQGGYTFYMTGSVDPSPNHQLLAWTEDTVGGEKYTLRVKVRDLLGPWGLPWAPRTLVTPLGPWGLPWALRTLVTPLGPWGLPCARGRAHQGCREGAVGTAPCCGSSSGGTTRRQRLRHKLPAPLPPTYTLPGLWRTSQAPPPALQDLASDKEAMQPIDHTSSPHACTPPLRAAGPGVRQGGHAADRSHVWRFHLGQRQRHALLHCEGPPGQALQSAAAQVRAAAQVSQLVALSARLHSAAAQVTSSVHG